MSSLSSGWNVVAQARPEATATGSDPKAASTRTSAPTRSMRGADEDGVDGGRQFGAVGYLQIGLEAGQLAAVGVAPYGHIDRLKTRLVLAAVPDVGGEQDGACAGAQHRHAIGEPRRQRRPQAAAVQQLGHRGRLPAGDDQRVDVVERRCGAHLAYRRAQAFDHQPVRPEGALKRQHTNRRPGSAQGYQPRSEKLISCEAESSPRMASPRPRLTRTTVSGSW